MKSFHITASALAFAAASALPAMARDQIQITGGRQQMDLWRAGCGAQGIKQVA